MNDRWRITELADEVPVDDLPPEIPPNPPPDRRDGRLKRILGGFRLTPWKDGWKIKWGFKW